MATESLLTNTSGQPGAMLKDGFPDLLDTSFEKIKIQTWDKASKENVLKDLFHTVNTSKDYIKLSSVAKFGLMTESADEENLPKDSMIQGFDTTITPIDYRKSFAVTARLRETDQHAVIGQGQRALAESAPHTQVYLQADVFNTSFGSNATFLAADGGYVCTKSRPFEDPAVSGTTTWDNEETSGAFTRTTLETMRKNFIKTRNARGLTSPQYLKKLLIPVDLQETVHEVIKSDLKSDTALNDDNFQKTFSYDTCVSPHLTSATAWWGLAGDPKSMDNGLKWVWRIRPQTGTLVKGDNAQVVIHWIRMSCAPGACRMQNLRGNLGT